MSNVRPQLLQYCKPAVIHTLALVALRLPRFLEQASAAVSLVASRAKLVMLRLRRVTFAQRCFCSTLAHGRRHSRIARLEAGA